MSEQDQAFFRTFLMVMGGLVAIAILAFITAQIATRGSVGVDPNKGARVQQEIEEYIAPVGQVAVGKSAGEAVEVAPAASEVASKSGAEVVQVACVACHGSGALGAPKIGDKSAWENRLDQGLGTLVHNAINGINAMPARGGNPSLSEQEIRSAVVAMLEDSGLSPEASSTAQRDTESSSAEAAMAAAQSEESSAISGPSADSETAVEEAAQGPSESTSQDEPDLAKGKQVYNQACFACHGTGAAGAPRLGDQSAWSARIGKGMETLITHAVQGYQGSKGYMPPKGGYPDLGKQEVAAAIAYIVSESH